MSDAGSRSTRPVLRGWPNLGPSSHRRPWSTDRAFRTSCIAPQRNVRVPIRSGDRGNQRGVGAGCSVIAHPIIWTPTAAGSFRVSELSDLSVNAGALAASAGAFLCSRMPCAAAARESAGPISEARGRLVTPRAIWLASYGPPGGRFVRPSNWRGGQRQGTCGGTSSSTSNRHSDVRRWLANWERHPADDARSPEAAWHRRGSREAAEPRLQPIINFLAAKEIRSITRAATMRRQLVLP